MEIWKDVKGYEGIYQVSTLGRLKSLSRVSCGRKYKEKIRSLKSYGSYVVVVLSKEGKNKTTRLHRLVAETFIPNPERKSEVNHIDGNKSNNTVENLEWVTKLENNQHAWNTGLTKRPPAEEAKAVIQLSKNNEFISEYSSIKEAAFTLKICDGDICRCCKGKRKTAGGYRWKYKEEKINGN